MNTDNRRYLVTYVGDGVVTLAGSKFQRGTSAGLALADARLAAERGDFEVLGLDETAPPPKAPVAPTVAAPEPVRVAESSAPAPEASEAPAAGDDSVENTDAEPPGESRKTLPKSSAPKKASARK